MSLPEEPKNPETPEASGEDEQSAPVENTPAEEELFPEEPILPEDFTPIEEISRLPRARRRRARRTLAPAGASERAALLDNLSRRSIPSFEFFLLALLCGLVLGAAYLFDSPALLLVGVLVAPMLTPWVGLTLAARTGSWRFFFQTLGGFLVACGLVFLGGWLAGLAGHLWKPLSLFYADVHSHLWWPDLFIVALGGILLAISFVRSEQKPFIASAMLAYGFFLPLNAAGVGLGNGAPRIWPDGILVFIVHVTLALLTGCLTLAILRFKPTKAIGHFLSITITLVSLAALVIFTGLAGLLRDQVLATRWVATATPTSLSLPTLTSGASAGTTTPTFTPRPSATPRPSDTPQPTAAYAIITSPEFGGANVRTEAGEGTLITTLANGATVEVLPETKLVGSVTWVHIRMHDNTEGWVLQSVLTSATLTPTTTLTPTP